MQQSHGLFAIAKLLVPSGNPTGIEINIIEFGTVNGNGIAAQAWKGKGVTVDHGTVDLSLQHTSRLRRCRRHISSRVVRACVTMRLSVSLSIIFHLRVL